MDFSRAELNPWLQRVWDRLGIASQNATDPFRTPALASVENGMPRLRMVVLREVDSSERRLTFFSDGRSPKNDQMRQNPSVEWLFYDSKEQWQIRLQGRASISQLTDRARECWKLVPAASRENYQSDHAPGAKIANHNIVAQLSEDLSHFSVVDTVVTQIDSLRLQPESRRARWIWTEGEWTGDWIVP